MNSESRIAGTMNPIELDIQYYLSLGVGKQSTLIALMIANKDSRLPEEYYDSKIIFSDTNGEEWHTYSYLHGVLKPYLKERGKEVIYTIAGNGLLNEFSRKQKVPMGWANPLCSSFAKRDNIRKYYREQHGTNGRIYAKETKIIELIGITTDEITRAKDSNVSWLERRYPLIDLGLSRSDLDKIYEEYDVEIPKKSGCWFCPNKGKSQFQKLKFEEPQFFEKLVAMEKSASKKHGNQVTFIYNFKLENLQQQSSLDDFDFSDQMCDSGYCLT